MSEQEQRYDRLASRLAILVSRLFMGETLSVRQLAQEFGVSERTVQRDLRERLRYIDTEYSGGNFRLRDARGPFRTNCDIIRFAQITRVAHYFPALDPKLLSVLLDSGQDSPCIIWNTPPPSGSGVVWRFSGHYPGHHQQSPHSFSAPRTPSVRRCPLPTYLSGRRVVPDGNNWRADSGIYPFSHHRCGYDHRGLHQKQSYPADF